MKWWLLAVCLVSSCKCENITFFGAHYFPTVGTLVVDFPMSNSNYTFKCDQFRQDSQGSVTQVTTIWSLDNFIGLDLVIINPELHTEFVVSGTERNGSIPFPTFRNELTIVNLTQRLHNVTLYCGHDSLDGSWDLKLYSGPALNDVQLAIIEGAELSVDLSLDQVAAFPYPIEIEWRMDGQILTNSSTATYGYPAVRLSSVNREDAGTYTLSATNYELEDQQSVVGTCNGSLHLQVYYGPEITEIDKGSLVGLEDTNVTLVCGASLTGNPIPTVQWSSNQGDLINTTHSRYTLNNGPEVVSLVITGAVVNDSGNWTCSLTNDKTGAFVERLLLLTVLDVPSPPANVSVLALGPTWLYITWTDQSMVIGFIVVATSPHTETVIARTGPVDRANVTGLDPGVQYTITVFALNELDGVQATSASSAYIVVDTNTSVPEIECTSVMSSDGVVVVSWEYVHTGGLDLTALMVEYRSSEDDQVLDSLNTDTQQTSLQVGGLIAGLFYTLTVTASNDLGDGQVVCPVLWHSTGIPQTPVIHVLHSNTPLEVVLSVSSQATGTLPNDPSFSFIIQVQRINVSFQVSFASPDYVDGTIIELSISGLLAGELVEITASASNQYGSTPFTEPVQTIVMSVSNAQEIPVAAVAGGTVGGALVVVLLLLVVIVAVCMARTKRGHTNTKNVRSDSLEMISNQNYGKCGGSEPNTPQYEAIPVNISRPPSNNYQPSNEKTSDNPLYSSTGELRASMVYNPYDVLPAGVRSKEVSRANSPALRHQSISLPPRPLSQTLYHMPVYSNPASDKEHNGTQQTEPVYSEL